MHGMYIPHLLNAVNRTRTLIFETFFSDLETLTPVRAKVSVRHGTTFLEVKGTAHTIVTLTCDRCLQQYNYRVVVDAEEIIWLTESASALEEVAGEQEISPEDLVESLPPQGYFEPDTWIYEQVCLSLPQRQICSPDCQGIIIESQVIEATAPLIDQRWAALASLQRQLPGDDSQLN